MVINTVRLWSVSVDGRPVTARQAGEDVLIPLPGEADPNVPVEVGLRLGTPAQGKSHVAIQLPIVFAPVLKTQWNVQADENHVLVPNGGSVEPAMPVLWPSGFVLAGRARTRALDCGSVYGCRRGAGQYRATCACLVCNRRCASGQRWLVCFSAD